MDHCEKFKELHYLKKKNITVTLTWKILYIGCSYAQAKRIYRDFEIKHLEEYHDLHVQNGTLLLAYVFEKF